MTRGDARRCILGRNLTRDVLDRKLEVGRVARVYRRAVDFDRSTAPRYKADLETAKAKRINSVTALAEHDLACDVCGRNVS